MAGGINSSGGNSGGRRSRRRNGFSEINVTPMVDVMLVLLIIFMVAAPMLTEGVKVDLPQAKASPLQDQDKPLNIYVQKDGKISLETNPILIDEIANKLKAIAGEKVDTRIFIRGDKGLDYGRMMRVVGEVNAAGFSKIALITDQIDEAPVKK